jgi:hypothetical protein
MTEREALKLALGFVEEHARHWTGVGRSGRDVVTAVKEALAQPEQEPVAIADGTFNHNCPVGTPLYTTPPQRTWVGLTDEERGECINANFGTGLWFMAKDIEAKLKSKNI